MATFKACRMLKTALSRQELRGWALINLHDVFFSSLLQHGEYFWVMRPLFKHLCFWSESSFVKGDECRGSLDEPSHLCWQKPTGQHLEQLMFEEMKTLSHKGVGDVPWVSRPGGHIPLPSLLYQRPSVQDVPSSLAGEAFGLPYFKRLTQILFQIQTNFDIRERIGKSHSFEEFRDCVLLLKERSDTKSGSAFPHFVS